VGGKVYKYVIANAARGNQAITKVSINSQFFTWLYLFVSTYLSYSEIIANDSG
jgi:hypothetical protein